MSDRRGFDKASGRQDTVWRGEDAQQQTAAQGRIERRIKVETSEKKKRRKGEKNNSRAFGRDRLLVESSENESVGVSERK